jgi:hypothetical protein
MLYLKFYMLYLILYIYIYCMWSFMYDIVCDKFYIQPYWEQLDLWNEMCYSYKHRRLCEKDIDQSSLEL